MYIAHHLYDESRYREALDMFKSVDTDLFSSKEMSLKTFEYRLCCYIKVNGFTNSYNKIEQFIQTVSSRYDLEDVSPDALLNVFSNLGHIGGENAIKKFNKFLKKIDQIYKFNWFEGLER